MKRFPTLLILSFFLYQAQAQDSILFSQDFESGSIAPFTAVDVDGKTVDPNIASVAGKTWKVVGTVPNRRAVSTSWYTPVGYADDWLISPPIAITDTNTFLFWESVSPDQGYRDGYEVRVSTTDNQVASFTNILLTIPAEQTTTTKRALQLDDFIGDTIHFAFRNNSYDKFLLYIDNISVRILVGEEIVVKGVSIEKYNSLGTQVPVTVSVENNGANAVSSVIFTWSEGTNTHVDTVNGLNIGTREIKDVTHGLTFDVTEIGEFPLSITLEQPNGVNEFNPNDNTAFRTLYGMSEQLPKKVVVEEGTGSWCGWCPRGFVAMEKIAVDYADVVIPIAIHNYDPMLVPNYDTPFSQSISGYPSGHVDRKEIDVDPDDPQTHYGFDNAIENLDNRMVPVQIDVQTTFDPLSRTVYIKAIAHSSIPTMDNYFRFASVITENNVTGPSTNDPLTDYDQVNYYSGGTVVMGGFQLLPDPVPASQMIYNFVARALLGGYDGLENSIPNALQVDEEFEVEFSYQIPAAYDEKEMKAIVLILDDETGEILNSNIANVVEITSIPLIPLGKSVLYPNPATDVINLSVDFQTTDPVNMNIYDTYGRLIKSLGNLDLSGGSKIEKIDVTDLHTGNYVLELRHKNAVSAFPFTRI